MLRRTKTTVNDFPKTLSDAGYKTSYTSDKNHKSDDFMTYIKQKEMA